MAEKKFTYSDYTESEAVKAAKEKLDAQLAQKPNAYTSSWQSKLDDVLGKIQNREDFQYDLNGDALYQQYKDQYVQQGKMAMMDTMGQAAALTGGYGNSYAQSVGQQAYQGYLQGLNDKVPQLYQLALDKYNTDTDALYNKYALLSDAESQDYNRYRDTVSDWQSEQDRLQSLYDSERNYDYNRYVNDRDYSYGVWSDAEDRAYQEQRDAVADSQWQAEYNLTLQKLAEEKASSSSTSSGGSSGGGDADTRAMQEKLNAMGANLVVDGVWGAKTQAAYEKYMTRNNAVSYLKSNGVDSASSIMTESEWKRRKASYQNYGTGGVEVTNYDSYQEYLADIIEYKMGG